MNILFVAAEASPLVKVGGLADVVGSLPKALKKLGHDVRVMLPKYHSISNTLYDLLPLLSNIRIKLSQNDLLLNVFTTDVNAELKFYLIENKEFFDIEDIYGGEDLKRFLLFDKAVVEVIPKLEWKPDVVHCHDWHTGFIPNWLKAAGWKGSTLFTIHNLNYQGAFGEKFMAEFGLEQEWHDLPINVPKPPLNFISQGIIWSDAGTTVSEHYAREITTSEFGAGLDAILRRLNKRFQGIINGIDYEYYNPEKDRMIKATYDCSNIKSRIVNKAFLQKKKGLLEDVNIPLIGIVSRLDEQKGIDLVIEGIPSLLERTNVQVVILGRGNDYYQRTLKKIANQYRQKLVISNKFDETMAHLIYAGCDMFLMPSRFEPCGLGQLIAMRYGAIPIVRHTGGLVDTVVDLSPDLSSGSGFVFKEYSVDSMLQAIQRAIQSYKFKRSWQRVIKRVMSLDFSWRNSALKYELVYKHLLRLKENAKK